jgi:hypothetical protein
MKLAVAMPVCCRNASEIRAGYAFEALALQQCDDLQLEIYVRDEGPVPISSDRWTRLAIDLLTRRGHAVNYIRRSCSNGVAAARHDLLRQIPPQLDRILLIDEDMVLLPNAVSEMLNVAEKVSEFGFIQGMKLELDAQRTYYNDINVLNRENGSPPAQLYFGDAAFLLVQRPALGHVRWDIVLRFAQEHLAGEDVAMSLMISDRLPCYSAPDAIGYHMSLQEPRWRWEPATDALQVELLRGVVSVDTLRRAMPHMASFIDAGH